MGKLARVLSLFAFTSIGFSATVGQWTGNNGLWASSGNFSTLYSAITATGSSGQPLHSVSSVTEIEQTNLNKNGFLIVADAQTAMTGAQVSAIRDWVHSGGILLLFATPSGTTTSVNVANSILESLGTPGTGNAMSMNGQSYSTFWGAASGPLNGSDAAVTGIGGSNIAWYAANGVSGGQSLSQDFGGYYDLGNMLRVGSFQLGKAYVFGDRFDANYNLSGYQQGSNLQFFLNILAQGGYNPPEDPFTDAPEPATITLTGIALFGVALYRHRRRS